MLCKLAHFPFFRPYLFTLGHYHNASFLLAFSFQLHITANDCGKEDLIDLYSPFQIVFVISEAYHGLYLVHHGPYRLLAFFTQLMLPLFCEDVILRSNHQQDSLEPVHIAQTTDLHYGAAP